MKNYDNLMEKEINKISENITKANKDIEVMDVYFLTNVYEILNIPFFTEIDIHIPKFTFHYNLNTKQYNELYDVTMKYYNSILEINSRKHIKYIPVIYPFRFLYDYFGIVMKPNQNADSILDLLLGKSILVENQFQQNYRKKRY